jgi:A/G-specific adenine glycosylase
VSLWPTPELRAQLLRWYDRDRRDLPWRAKTGESLDPYRVLVSEAMLQQTQVATVIPYFHRFLDAFPTVRALASSDEQQVLRLWQGLGYYSRARNLRRAAQAIVNDHAGVVPDTVEALLSLPGVGRYTAGAVASIAHGVRAPIVDGNVVRVICRLDAITADPRDREVLARLWSRAEELVPADRPGDFNSAMMELGATVCTPRNPNCLICPVQGACEARATGQQELIPLKKQTKQTPLEERTVWCVHRPETSEYLFEQRPSNGRWAGMWQFVTRPTGEPKTPAKVEHIGAVAHALTHRRYTFGVIRIDEGRCPKAILQPGEARPTRWLTLAASDALPLPKPHVKIREMLEVRQEARGIGKRQEARGKREATDSNA